MLPSVSVMTGLDSGEETEGREKEVMPATRAAVAGRKESGISQGELRDD